LLHQPEPLKQGILPPVLEQQGLSLADAMKVHAEAQKPLKQGILPPVLEQQGLSLADAMKAHAEAQKAAADKARELTANQKLLADAEKALAHEIEKEEAALPEALPVEKKGTGDILGLLGKMGIGVPRQLAPILSGGGVGGGAGLGGLAAIGAVVYAVEKLKEQVERSVVAFKNLSLAMLNPDANPASFVQALGSYTTEITKGVPIIEQFGGAVGGAINALGSFMRALDGMVERYAQYSPQLAAAQAQANVTQILGDIRRAQQAAPELIRYIKTRTELQQKIEDAKIRFLNVATPFITATLDMLTKMLEIMGGLENLPRVLNAFLPESIRILLGLLQAARAREEATEIDPLDELLKSTEGPAFREVA
jgi:hypothetical protein